MNRERKTVSLMISLYCRDNHQVKELCPDCAALHDYAMERLGKCPFQEGKTVCALCLVHCYKPEEREKIRQVMRYAGPRMLTRHPALAVYHLLDRRRKKPIKGKFGKDGNN
jgi:hypothetical protein